jgi:hypothetical protein
VCSSQPPLVCGRVSGIYKPLGPESVRAKPVYGGVKWEKTQKLSQVAHLYAVKGLRPCLGCCAADCVGRLLADYMGLVSAAPNPRCLRLLLLSTEHRHTVLGCCCCELLRTHEHLLLAVLVGWLFGLVE